MEGSVLFSVRLSLQVACVSTALIAAYGDTARLRSRAKRLQGPGTA